MMAASIMHVTDAKKAEVVFGCILHQVEIVFTQIQIDGTIFITKEGKRVPINFNQISEIIESVAYWRKANAIHKWFVDNVQNGTDDCGKYRVTVDQLKQLVKACKDIPHRQVQCVQYRASYQATRQETHRPQSEVSAIHLAAQPYEYACILPHLKYLS